jgi:hypothetical protein
MARKTDILNDMALDIHTLNSKWWVELDEVLAVLPEKYHEFIRMLYKATKIALMHSELSEMLEGVRKGTMDSHLPHLSAESVEGADLFIRFMDYIGRGRIDIARAVDEKLAYNLRRADHKPEARAAAGGKKF